MHQWTTEGFDAFRRGTFGNGGQNIYVSRAGVLQRIHRTSLFSSGFVDLVYCNSQRHEELVPIAVYPDPLGHPDEKRELYIGGANDVAVADLGGEGREDMAWSCGWDGLTLHNVSGVYFNSDNGPSDSYVNYLPARSASAVAAGDFNGDGRNDLVFFSAGELKLMWQDETGFGPRQVIHLPASDVTGLAAFHFAGEKLATLFLRKKDGSVTMHKEFTAEAAEIPLLPADPEYVQKEHSWDSYTQAVSDSAPKFRFVGIDGRKYLTVFRKSCLLLYPVGERALVMEPVRIECQEGSAAEAGDVFGRGCTDLLVSTRNGSGKHECSWLYLGDGKAGFSNERRLAIDTFRASDVAMGNFSGGKGLDLVVCQSHTHASFESDVLVYPTGTLTEPAIPEPVRLPSCDPTRVVVVHDRKGRPYLCVGNHHSGSYIGNPDNDIYFGSETGYHVHDHLGLPGWGSVDCICADFDDDGKADIAFANAAELAPWMDYGSYLYYQKDGAFSRQPKRLHTNRAHGLVTGDFFHTGYLDLLFCGFDNPVLKLYHGGPDGYSEERCTIIPLEDKASGKSFREPRFISVADLNGDGYLDLLINDNCGEESYVLWGGPEGFSFANRQTFKVHNGVNSKVADLNGNGYPDIIFAPHAPTAGEPHDAFLCIYWGGPDGYSECRKTMLPCNAANSVSIGDFNGDGLLDIFIASYQNAMERDIPSFIYWNSPDGFRINRRTRLMTHAVSGSVAADFLDKGHVDLAVANHKVEGNHIAYSTVWYNDGEGFDERNTVNLPSSGPHGMYNVDPGNIMDRSFDEFYESEPFAVPEGEGVTCIRWDADVPAKCDVMAQLRVADSLEELAGAKWMGPTNTHDRFRAYDHVDRDFFTGKYVQYRLALYAFNAVETPRVRKVVVEFDTLGQPPKLF